MRHSLTYAILAACLVITTSLVGVCVATEETKGQTKDKPAPSTQAQPAAQKPAAAVDEVAVLETSLGTIVIEFFPKDAPNHVENFKKLARKGFYDGTKFHRVISGFMVQGGDPLSKDNIADNDGTGDPGYRIKAEFNQRKHLKGTLSMARGQDVNSAGCQFFICLDAQSGLDGKYTVFGQVLDGTKVLEAIGKVKVKENKWGETSVPVEPVLMKKATIVARADYDKTKKAGPEEDKTK
ncbi:MAG: peptidylprolyl isomerase [Candidatus Eisenbacteria bacterium]